MIMLMADGDDDDNNDDNDDDSDDGDDDDRQRRAILHQVLSRLTKNYTIFIQNLRNYIFLKMKKKNEIKHFIIKNQHKSLITLIR